MPWLILWTKFPSTDETGCAMVLSFKDYMIVCAKWALYLGFESEEMKGASAAFQSNH
jgi:hypothetical protein